MKYKYSSICLVVSFILFGCGQDNPTLTGTTPPAKKISGTYMLSSSGTYVYTNGILSFDMANSITGTLILGDNTWDETYVVDGVTYSINNATYNINYTNGTSEGLIQYVYPDGAGGYSFTIDGLDLHFSGSPNTKWTKLSDSQ